MKPIIKKELLTYFTTPIGYIFLATSLLLNGYYLLTGSIAYGSSDLTVAFASIYTTTLILIPILTMNSFSSERKTGISYIYFTSKIKPSTIYMSKLISALIMFSLTLIVTLLFSVIIMIIGNLSISLYFTQLLGALLLAISYISISLTASYFVKNSVASAIISVISLFLYSSVDSLSSLTTNTLAQKIIIEFSPLQQYQYFLNGIVGLKQITYFLFVPAFCFLIFILFSKKNNHI